MIGYDSYKELAVDVSLDNRELRDQLEALRADYNDEKRRRLAAEIEAKILRNAKFRLEPVACGGGECECPNCCVRLEREYRFCPGCGGSIDWEGDAE